MTRKLGARFSAQREYNKNQGEKQRESVFHSVCDFLPELWCMVRKLLATMVHRWKAGMRQR